MKKLLSIILACTCLCSVTAFAENKDITLTVNGSPVICDVPPQIVDDRVLTPLRAAAEALGAGLFWDGDTASIHMQNAEGEVISMQIGSFKLFTPEGIKPLEAAPVIIGDRTMVPIAAIARCVNCQVSWNEESRTVEITK